MPIRVVCSECQSKLDIRDELAGSKRRCPKCKTEFVVPLPAEVGSEVAAAREDELPESSPVSRDQEDEDEAALPSTTLNAAEAFATESSDEENEDEEDLDYLPDFITSAKEPVADEKPKRKPFPRPAAKPLVDDDSEDEDEEEDEEEEDDEEEDDGEPFLSIPKAPEQPKRKSFDPAFLESNSTDEPESKTPAPAAGRRGGKPGGAALDQFFADTFDKSHSTPDFKLPAPKQGAAALSETVSDSRNVTRDRAQAARELRQALKDSALNPATVTGQQSSKIGFDFLEFMQEFGWKILAFVVGLALFFPLLYYVSDSAIGRKGRPPLGQVQGKVTMDGQPVARAMVWFQPVNESGEVSNKKDEMKRASIGVTDEQGNFKMTYEERFPGVAVGKCRVWLTLPPPLHVPPEYSMGSITLKDVAKGKQTINFELTSPKKR